jgi:hypothetical protein
MTTPGSRRHNNTGRSTDRMKPHRQSGIDGPFVPHTREMLVSPAWGALTLNDRKVIDRLCIEHMAHAGTENGNLKCTWVDFESYGIRRKSIAQAIRRVEALGFIETMERGRIAKGEFRFPALYRLTFVTGNLPATNEWQRIKTREEAKAIAKKAAREGKNKKPGAKTPPLPGAESPPLAPVPGGEIATPVPGAKVPPLSISRGGSPETHGQTKDERSNSDQHFSASKPAINGHSRAALPTTIHSNPANGGQDNGI